MTPRRSRTTTQEPEEFHWTALESLLHDGDPVTSPLGCPRERPAWPSTATFAPQTLQTLTTQSHQHGTTTQHLLTYLLGTCFQENWGPTGDLHPGEWRQVVQGDTSFLGPRNMPADRATRVLWMCATTSRTTVLPGLLMETILLWFMGETESPAVDAKERLPRP